MRDLPEAGLYDMILDLSHMRGAHDHLERTYEPETFGHAEADDFVVAAPVRLILDIYKDGQKYRLAGRARTTLQLTCSRCLENFASPVDAAFDLRYLPHTAVAAEADAEVEIEEDDLSTAFYDDESIDLGQLVREQFYLALPMKPLCSEDCRGLCVQCGASLNREPCGCKIEWVDPRLEALKALLNDSKPH